MIPSRRCGVSPVDFISFGTGNIENYNDVRVKDQIEVFDTREVARQL